MIIVDALLSRVNFVFRSNATDYFDAKQSALIEILQTAKSNDFTSVDSFYKVVTNAVLKSAKKQFNYNYSTRLMSPGEIEDYDWDDFENLPNINPISTGVEGELLSIIYTNTKKQAYNNEIRSDLLVVNSELIEYFKKHPKDMYNLNPRKFEELIGLILSDLGYSVELTKNSADGGIDIIATQKDSVGETMLVVDCKRYKPDSHVGVGVVRALYGISQHIRATIAMIATTSFFTRPAKEFQKSLSY